MSEPSEGKAIISLRQQRVEASYNYSDISACESNKGKLINRLIYLKFEYDFTQQDTLVRLQRPNCL